MCETRCAHAREKRSKHTPRNIVLITCIYFAGFYVLSVIKLADWMAGWFDSTRLDGCVACVCVCVRVIENQIKSVHWFCNGFLVLRDSYHLRSYLSVDPFISMCHSAQVNKPCGCVRYISVNTLIRLIQLNWSANIQPSSWVLKSGSSFKKCKPSVFRRNAYHCGVIYKSYMHSSFR